ncbi:hypothetical protein [Sphingomonas sp.]|uniref:hypothetical protein n=1 Tax=Sphingomonas sp. TaxID=28214 RepID=UPI003B3B8BEA
MRLSYTYLAAAAIALGTSSAKACDPAITPLKDILTRSGVNFVAGRYNPDGTFLVDDALGTSVPPQAYQLFERGPFGNQCETAVMKVSPPSSQQGDGKRRFLLPIEKADPVKRQLLVIMGFPYRLVLTRNNVTDQYSGTSIPMSKFRRAAANFPSLPRR